VPILEKSPAGVPQAAGGMRCCDLKLGTGEVTAQQLGAWGRISRKNGGGFTLPETNIASENRPSPKERIVFQPSIFSCYVGFREGSR